MPLYGFSSPSSMNCTYVSANQALRITRSFPSTQLSLAIQVSGIINPSSERTVSSFIVQTYDSQNSLIESSPSGQFFVQPTATPLQSVVLTNDNQVVGMSGNLLLTLMTQNSLPQNGYLTLAMPKWNSGSQSMLTSYFLDSVSCLGTLNINTQIVCSLQSGTNSDVLTIKNGYLDQGLAGGRQIKIVIPMTRNPPSTAPISSINVTTMDASGNRIDYMNNIFYKASTPATLSPTNINIQPDNMVINQNTFYLISIKLLNPAPTGSLIQFIFPKEVYLISPFTGQVLLQSIYQTGKYQGYLTFQIYQLDSGATKVVMSDAIQSYMDAGSNLNFRFSSALNSVIFISSYLVQYTTAPTSSFQYSIMQNYLYSIEQLSANLTLQFSPSTIPTASLTASNLSVFNSPTLITLNFNYNGILKANCKYFFSPFSFHYDLIPTLNGLLFQPDLHPFYKLFQLSNKVLAFPKELDNSIQLLPLN